MSASCLRPLAAVLMLLGGGVSAMTQTLPAASLPGAVDGAVDVGSDEMPVAGCADGLRVGALPQGAVPQPATVPPAGAQGGVSSAAAARTAGWVQPGARGVGLPVPSATATTAATAADGRSGGAGLSAPGAAPAADAPPLALALEPVLRQAACRAIGVRRGLAEQQSAQAVRDQAAAAWWPQLAVSTTRSNVPQYDSVTREHTLRGNVTLLDFGARRAALRAGDQGVEAARQERQARWLQALATTVDLYADAWAAQGRLEAAQANLDSAQAGERAAAGRQRGGAASIGETLQAQRARSQAALELARARAAFERAQLGLRVALGLPEQRPLRLDAEPALAEALQAAAAGAATAGAGSAAEHPQRRAAEARLAQALSQREAVQAQRHGALSLDGSLTRNQSTGAPGYTTRAIGLTWTLPLFDGGARERQAEADAEAARLDAEQVARTLRLQQRQQRVALDGERAALREAERLLASALQAWTVVQERFRLGVSGWTELLATQDALAAARLQLAGVRAELLRARWQLALAADAPLPGGLERP